MKVIVYENVTEHKFAAILTNPPIRAGKRSFMKFYEESYEESCYGWRIVDCYSKETRCTFAIEKLEEIFEEVEVVEKKKGYYIIKA